MVESSQISYLLAFAAGFLSFVSPCVFPLIPSYGSFITGISFEELVEGQSDRRVARACLFNSLAFILGFTIIFVALGVSTSLVAEFLREYRTLIKTVGGVLVILFGLFVLGVLKLDFLTREKKLHLGSKPAGYLGSVLVGITFGLGWTPCIGPILGSILTLAATGDSPWYGLRLLLLYSIGLGLPFLLTSLVLDLFLLHMPKITRHMQLITRLSGLVLVAVGVLLLSGKFAELAQWAQSVGLGWDIDLSGTF